MNAIPSSRPDAQIAPLECAGITKVFESATVLRGVDLTVPRGAVFGLIGRNGAGKTTLIRILLGLLTPDAGTSRAFGASSLPLPDSAKARLGYVPQQPDALDWMRVGDMLNFVGQFYPRWNRRYVEDSLLRWSIAPAQLLSRLSAGERQRVALIRALALEPELLVLDEPAAALDPVARRELLREIALRAAESGTTVLFSTHILSDLERVASHLCILHEGRAKLVAEADDFNDTHALLGLPPGSSLAMHIDGEIHRRRRPDGSWAVVVARSPEGSWPSETRLPGAQLAPLTLEDAFIEIAQ